MQSVSSAFTAEETDSVRRIAHNLQVSWKKDSTLGNRTFTIGVSIIGGTDIIGVNPGAIGSPGNYKYFDESAYATYLAWERGLQTPYGGLSMALAEAQLDNTDQRFTPSYMGGQSELFTAILPKAPMIINAGFKIGNDQTIPQFAGLISDQPEVNQSSREVSIKATDYMGFFQNRFLDQEVMVTAERTDEIMETMLRDSLGMSTSQYELDYGINIIPFALFPVGTRMSELFNNLAQAENGYFYQDEAGKFRFENRQHWDSSPYTQVQRILTTADVLNHQVTDASHIINVVEINGEVRGKQQNQIIFTLSTPIPVPGGQTTDVFITFDDPILEIDTPSTWTANTLEDETGTDITASVSIVSIDKFSQATKIRFRNVGASGFITKLDITGRPARVVSEFYYRSQASASVTAYQERVLSIDNPFVTDRTWARSLAQMILNDYSSPENLQEVTIRAIPELQMGDLISWQGRYWRIFNIRARIDPSSGFTQELTLLQRTITSYFRIGISTIGGGDVIAP